MNAHEPHDDTAGERGRVKIMFFPGCLVTSIILSVVLTVLLNLGLRLFH